MMVDVTVVMTLMIVYLSHAVGKVVSRVFI